jgi:outer membrane protein assembly factor BamB
MNNLQELLYLKLSMKASLLNNFSIIKRYVSMSNIFLLSLICLAFFQCDTPDNYALWQVNYETITAYSSPRATDLNGDGVLDIVIGTGSGEWIYTSVGVLAIDGNDGKRLWHLPARNQIVGSAVFYDITGDKIDDVFIGGRSAELKAINGATGELIWEFFSSDDAYAPKQFGWFNFSSPQLIPDQNNDGYNDLLIANGGDATLRADNPNRPIGKLMIISSKDKRIIAQASMPDNKETYFSPLVLENKQDSTNPSIIFGTGGETISGHLYRTTLKEVLNQDISNAMPLITTLQKGIIAPSVLADITQDGVLDIIQNIVEGKTVAIDGKTSRKLWQVNLENTEAYNQPAVGYFNEDNIPDFFVNFSEGVWPSFRPLIHYAFIDGKTGDIIYQSQLHGHGFSFTSPLTLDINGDKISDVLLTVNQRDSLERGKEKNFTKLLCFDVKNRTTYFLKDELAGTNWACTPWVGDLDKDNRTDIVYVSAMVEKEFDPESAFYSIPKQMSIKRYILGELDPIQVSWGSYMGNQYNSILSTK